MELFQSLNNEGMTIVMVTHSPDYSRVASRILQVSDGTIQGVEFPLKATVPPFEKVPDLDRHRLRKAAIQ